MKGDFKYAVAYMVAVLHHAHHHLHHGHAGRPAGLRARTD
jgi:hypothetical protein